MSRREVDSLLRRDEQLVEQVAAALYDHPTGGISGQARRWGELYSEEARESWRAAARKAISALDPDVAVVRVGDVPAWMKPWGYLRDGGGYVFDGFEAPERVPFEGQLRLYRLDSPATDGGDDG